MWNVANNETTGLEALLDELRRRLPRSWSLELTRSPASRRVLAPDAIIDIEAPDGTRAHIVVEFKARLQPLDVERLLRRLNELGMGVPLLFAPFLSPRTRDRITELGGNYADRTGNLHLVLSRPAVFIETTGADRDPAPEHRVLASLKGPAAGRVVRAACDFKPPYGVRQLASRCGAPPASVSRVLDLLHNEALVERTSRGGVVAVDWDKLIRRWVQDYGLTSSNATTTWLAPRGLSWVLGRLAATSVRYVVSGSFAASKLAAVAPPRLLTVYADSAPLLAEELDLRPAEAGANVLVVEPFDSVVFDRTFQRDDLTLANPSQIVADLLTSPGRGPAEAEALLAWMKEHEDAWRS